MQKKKKKLIYHHAGSALWPSSPLVLWQDWWRALKVLRSLHCSLKIRSINFRQVSGARWADVGAFPFSLPDSERDLTGRNALLAQPLPLAYRPLSPSVGGGRWRIQYENTQWCFHRSLFHTPWQKTREKCLLSWLVRSLGRILPLLILECWPSLLHGKDVHVWLCPH